MQSSIFGVEQMPSHVELKQTLWNRRTNAVDKDGACSTFKYE